MMRRNIVSHLGRTILEVETRWLMSLCYMDDSHTAADGTASSPDSEESVALTTPPRPFERRQANFYLSNTVCLIFQMHHLISFIRAALVVFLIVPALHSSVLSQIIQGLQLLFHILALVDTLLNCSGIGEILVFRECFVESRAKPCVT